MTNETSDEVRQLEAFKGHRRGPYLSFNPVSATQIWQWTSAMGDNNPAYQPGPEQIAPPAMMQMWTMRDINDRFAPGSTDEHPYQVFIDMETLGYPANVAVSYDITFHRYLRVGDRPRHYSTVVDISAMKSTQLGQGYFVTERVEYLTQHDDLFAEARSTYFQYRPAGDNQADSNSQADHRDARPIVPLAEQGADLGEFVAVDAGAVVAGDKLPGRAVPITHKLIVAGAIATQDFIPVHHNVPAAKAAAMPDIFMNILTTCGLSAGYLTDWAGEGSRLRQLKFSLTAPNLPGDVMVMEGEVAAVNSAANAVEVVVNFAGKNSIGFHVKGSATLELTG